MLSAREYIKQLIDSGEGLKLDFKFEISNAQKIAKTFVAFANTQGGRLLIGVKDNGVIAGIRTDQEIYMVESAAKLFSKPAVEYSVRQWNINGKKILEVKIPKSYIKPHFAKDFDKKMKAYIRVKDQILLATNVQIRAWQEKNTRSVNIKYSRKEELLLDYLKDFGSITFNKFLKLAQISNKEVENTLVNFLILDIITEQVTEKKITYVYNDNFE